jgi:hypothetical protein
MDGCLVLSIFKIAIIADFHHVNYIFSLFPFLSLKKNRAYKTAGCSPPYCTHASLCLKKGIEQAGRSQIDNFENPPPFLFQSLG